MRGSPAPLFESGYPCPEPLSGPAPFGDGMATAEVYVPGGAVLPGADGAAWHSLRPSRG